MAGRTIPFFTIFIIQFVSTLAAPSVQYVSVTDDLKNILKGTSHTPLFYQSDTTGFKSKIHWKNSPSELDWYWDKVSYTSLPLSSKFYKTQAGKKRLPRWDLIEVELDKLKEPLKPGQQWGLRFLAAMKVYNEKMIDGANNFQILNEPELQESLKDVVPLIVDHALKLPLRLSKPVPFLKQGQWHTLYLTRNLAASLLANAFFNTIPHHKRDKGKHAHFHFLILMQTKDSGDTKSNRVKIEKIKAILEYFRRLQDTNVDGDSIISFEKRSLAKTQYWGKSQKSLCKVIVKREGSIEDAGESMLQVDFANKKIGGGVLSDDEMTQEEIRFIISPELIVSRMFTETLGDGEALVVTGTKQFSSYSGYRDTFKFEKIDGDLVTPNRDNLGREYEQITAIDALYFKPGATSQFQKASIDRELHKSFVGFKHGPIVKGIATGNWGGGVFNGDRQLKFFVQWMSSSQNDRPSMAYYTRDDNAESKAIEDIFEILKGKSVTIGKLYNILMKYEKEGINGDTRTPVFDFVKSKVE